MSILHTVNKSPYQSNDMTSCLAHANPGDAVLLFENGVYAAVSGTQSAERIANSDLTIYVLADDLAARGIAKDKTVQGLNLIGYDDFVDLAVQHNAVNSWL